MNKLKVCIVGAGSIGTTKPDDKDYPGSENILTLANACHVHPDIDLGGIVDKDLDKAIKAGHKWSCFGTDKISDIESFDIAIVAVDTEAHYTVLKELIQYKPSLVICEKPFCSNLKEAEEISKLYKENNIPISIDYSRRFEEKHRFVFDKISNGNYGKILNCHIIYTHGFVHESCHAIDICNWAFGKFIGGRKFDSDLDDLSIFDKTRSAVFAFEKCFNVHFIPFDGRMYSVFEINIMTATGKHQFGLHGNEYRYFPAVRSNMYGNYPMLSYDAKLEKTKMNKVLFNLMDNAVRHLNGIEELFCTDKDAIKVHGIYNYLENQGE